MSKPKEDWYATIKVRRDRAGETVWLQGYNRSGDATQRSLTRSEARKDAGQRGCKAKFHGPVAASVAGRQGYADLDWSEEEGDE